MFLGGSFGVSSGSSAGGASFGVSGGGVSLGISFGGVSFGISFGTGRGKVGGAPLRGQQPSILFISDGRKIMELNKSSVPIRYLFCLITLLTLPSLLPNRYRQEMVHYFHCQVYIISSHSIDRIKRVFVHQEPNRIDSGFTHFRVVIFIGLYKYFS